MTRVLIQPDGIEFDVKPGDTLMGAATGLGYYWPTTCGGQGVCTTCLSEIVSGGQLLSEMSRSERKTLLAERGEAVLQRPLRLACQATVLQEGSIVIKKTGVRPAIA
ncbi:MAG TPA: 2Fe-2S iron-sulfur cluster-binding protein [Dehalococcoidia bacterium]|nr:2Fe-2S iron-sulfur cluster-binding protein [Dehalococcoidia bacterium]